MARTPTKRGFGMTGAGTKAAAAGHAALVEALEPRQLMAADPITPDNPSWPILPGEATVDGVLNEAAWATAFTVTRAEPFRNNSSAVVKFMFGQTGLYVGFDVKDTHLWSDGRAGTGSTVALANRWEVETDDSMSLYFDPNNSRDELFQPTDFAFAANLGTDTNFRAASGELRAGSMAVALPLAKYIRGNLTTPSAPGDVNPGGTIPAGVLWKTVLNGTVNQGSVITGGDIDVGWTTEMFFPWASIGMAGRPTSGTVIGMNFDIIFDNDGSTRDLTDYRSGPDRFNKPHFVDDHLLGVNSSYHSTLAGIRGPVNYAQVVFIDPGAATAPAAISGMTTAATTGYSTQLRFQAPAAVAVTNTGGASAYLIRYSTAGAISSDADWLRATTFENRYVPRLNGLAESLRLIGLTPNTAYHVAVRAVDAAGNVGPLSNSVTFTTQTTAQDPSGGLRVVPSPMGRSTVNELNQGFVPVGDHLGLPWNFTRNLYPGNVYDPASGLYFNFNANPSYEGVAGPYFDTLQSKGINLMRVYLELQNYNYSPAITMPNGTYWLEYPTGSYNGLMKQFMFNVLQEASQRGIYVIFSPFDTFSYDEAFTTEMAWSTARGGPLANINDFFQNSQTLQLAKNRMNALVGWINEPQFAPYRHFIYGWEPMSEWESYEWTLNAEGDPVNGVDQVYSNPGRETEMRRRAIWMDQLGAHIKTIDPNRMVLNSTIVRDPRGPLARQILNSRIYDALTPHFYTLSNSEPINSPDTNLTVRPAIENAGLSNYWLTHLEDRRPLINGEWGNSRFEWQQAGKGLPSFTVEPAKYNQLVDEAINRTMMWSGLASGQSGMGLRISTEELVFERIPGDPTSNQGLILTDTTRNLQRTFSRFVTGTSLNINFARYSPDPLAGRISAASAAGKSVLAWGSSDGAQGVVYVIQDLRRTTGSVSDARVTITGLRPDALIDVEFWSTLTGVTGPLSTAAVFVDKGTLTLTLPAFSVDMAIKFKAREVVPQTQKIVSIAQPNSPYVATVSLDLGGQPVVTMVNTQTNTRETFDLAQLSGFTQRVVDMTPLAVGNAIWLAATDTEHQLWLFQGAEYTGASWAWSVVNLTALINAPGITGDLTTYQPSWGAIHIAGLDARGHAVNYWFAPGLPTWQFNDLTEQFSGPVMSGGLTGYVTGWDGLNIAGVNSQGEVIVYWWAPGLGGTWNTINMTSTFSGERLVGQLDAYVTPWGGLNIAGLTSAGRLYTYWWAPFQSFGNVWQTADISSVAGGPTLTTGAESVVSGDGGLNLLGLDAGNNLQLLRWTPADPVWRSTNISSAATGPAVSFPIGSASSSTQLLLGARSLGTNRNLYLFQYDLSGTTWADLDTGLATTI